MGRIALPELYTTPRPIKPLSLTSYLHCTNNLMYDDSEPSDGEDSDKEDGDDEHEQDLDELDECQTLLILST